MRDASLDNVETMIAIHTAVVEGRPVLDRVVTVSGDAIEKPGNFKVLFGTNHRELIEAAGGFKTEPEKIISGGPMMGFAMFTLDAPITKTSSSDSWVHKGRSFGTCTFCMHQLQAMRGGLSKPIDSVQIGRSGRTS